MEHIKDKKGIAFFFLILSLISVMYLIPNVGANFACGFLNDSEEVSASWKEVLVYYEENPSETTTCKTSPENKFCCDLEAISSVSWAPGKVVHAEVFNPEQDYIAGPVTLLTTEEGFDIFPDMQLRKAITFNQPIQTILINNSQVFFNLSMDSSYNNLKYTLNSQSEQVVCELCTQVDFILEDLLKGKNNINLIVYNSEIGREITKSLQIFSLDYLDILDSFECPRCINRGERFYVPSNSEVNLTLQFNSSHEISGIAEIYFPVDWILDESFLPEDYSLTHNLVEWNIENSSNEEIIFPFVSSGIFFKRKDIFQYEIPDSGFSKEREVIVYGLTRFFPFSAYKEFSQKTYFKDSLLEQISPTEPLILDLDKDIFEVIAIYPKQEINEAYAYIAYRERRFFRNKYITFNLISNLANDEIESILFRFKIPKDNMLEFSHPEGDIGIYLYDQDYEYDYYEAYVDRKSTFKLKVY